ncbi:Aste57867_14090 [Aphanomyces stellatus]|uniref:Aste57867_14090 protein n=1 Tax=Aphanomyces stellatus TaxID=120398 RepID=A0A485L1F8_9STRA|nr:hypothetical protein As57867_014039 [Aphanomyces stellatus]VFT90918.1 Aste57867_14090 [Aphanomyces stellatus]
MPSTTTHTKTCAMSSSPKFERWLADAATAEQNGRPDDALAMYDQAATAMQKQYNASTNEREKRQLADAINLCSTRRCALLSTRSSVSSHIDVAQSALHAHAAATHGMQQAGGGKVMLGSAAAAAGVGLMVAGPLGCVVAAAGGAVMATQSGTPGELARATGTLMVASYDKAKDVNAEYGLTDKLKAGAAAAVDKAKALDAEYEIHEKATRLAKTGAAKASEINQKYHVTDKMAKATMSGLHSLTRVLKEGK